MKRIAKNLFAALSASVMLAACSQDGPDVEERYAEIVREVNCGSTTKLTITGYQSDNSYVGYTENDRNPGGSLFVANHIGTCLLKSDALPGTDYRIIVNPTVDVFPSIVTDWSTTSEAVIAFVGEDNCTLEGNLLTVKVSGAAGVYAYEFTLVNNIVKQSRARYCVLETSPLKNLEKYMAERFAHDNGVYFNAGTIGAATVLATMSGVEPYEVEVNKKMETVDSYVVTFMAPEMRN